MKKNLKIFLSSDPGQQFSQQILQFPLVKGIRLNTGAPITDSKTKILEEFQKEISPITPWVDLKGRELRLVKDATLPHDYLEINHKCNVKTPTELYYNEGKNFVIIDEIIDENKLHIKLPKNVTGVEEIKFGKGASFNIPDDSLEIHDYLTLNDKEYVEAAKKVGIHDFLLSFVESTEDINELLEFDPRSNIIAKIESKRGLRFVKHEYEQINKDVRLLAARADLYIELNRPHEILNALKLIIQKDAQAIVGSRILESFIEQEKIPRCSDFTDIGFLIEIGYKNFLLGDDLTQNSSILSSALGVLDVLIKNI